MFAVDALGGLVAGDTVAVIGPGPIGLTVAQILKALRAFLVILTGTRGSRLRLGLELGPDALPECSGAEVAVDQAIRMSMPGGRIVLVGFFHGPVTCRPQPRSQNRTDPAHDSR